MDLLIITATPRSNQDLAMKIAEIARGAKLEVGVVELESLKLPLYTPDQEALGIPDAARELSDRWTEARSFCLVAPEYNGSTPTVLNNAINWVSRTGGNWRESFQNKPVLLASSSGGPAPRLIQAMTSQCQHLGAVVLPRAFVVNSSQPLNEKALNESIELIKRLLGIL